MSGITFKIFFLSDAILSVTCIFRSNRPDVFLRKGVLKLCRKFIGEICCTFSEHLFLRTPLDGCFFSSHLTDD